MTSEGFGFCQHDPKAWDHRHRDWDEEVLFNRRKILMEGYWYTFNHKPIKRRLMIAALRVTPNDVEQLQQIEGSEVYDAERLARSGRPLAIRATSGHSFSGGHKYTLSVNIDFERMNMTLPKELAFKLAGGYHVTRIENLSSIVMKGIMPGGQSGGRDHVFFGEYAPWDPLNSSTLAYLGSDAAAFSFCMSQSEDF